MSGGIKIWIATVDVTKAFDSITHTSTQFLRYQSRVHQLVEENLQRPEASVHTDLASNMFEIKEGTKQGDSLCSLLFNTVLQNSLKEVTQRWQKKKGMGIYLSDRDHECFTNLRFDDDVLLFATSKKTASKNDVRIQGKY